MCIACFVADRSLECDFVFFAQGFDSQSTNRNRPSKGQYRECLECLYLFACVLCCVVLCCAVRVCLIAFACVHV